MAATQAKLPEPGPPCLIRRADAWLTCRAALA